MTKINYIKILILIVTFLILYFLTINSLHPIFTLILIIAYRRIICSLISIWSDNYIYSIILFLIIVRGILIIFLYFSRLISNEQTKLKFNSPLMLRFFLNIIFISYFIIFTKYHNCTYNEILHLFFTNTHSFNNIIHLYSYPYNNITIICIFYLLLTLFTIIKICSSKTSTLRKLT